MPAFTDVEDRCDIRVINWCITVIWEQIPLRDIGHIMCLIIFREKVVIRLILMRANFFRDGVLEDFAILLRFFRRNIPKKSNIESNLCYTSGQLARFGL